MIWNFCEIIKNGLKVSRSLRANKFAVRAIIINVKVREQGSDRRGIFPSVAPRIRISSIQPQPGSLLY
jgi:hypothetical protein